jgi:hypothetical protein
MSDLERKARAQELIQQTTWPNASAWIIERWLYRCDDKEVVVKAALDVAMAGGNGEAVISMYVRGELNA